MPVAGTTKQYNSFINGIVTDANEFNAPENAAREMMNVDILQDGSAARRKGFVATGSSRSFGSSLSQRPTINCVMWKGAGKYHSTNLIAAQVGYKLAVWGSSDTDIDSNYMVSLDLQTVVGTAQATLLLARWRLVPGDDGALYVFTGKSSPVRVTHDEGTGTLTGTAIDISVRDTEGADDGLDQDEEPITLSADHKYNLLNQGWTPDKITDYYNRVATVDYTWTASASFSLNDTARPTTLNGYYYKVISPGTSGGTEPTWPTNIGDTVVDNGVTWECVGTFSTYPSNAQQWFQGRDASGNFSPTELVKLDFGSAPVPRGRYIFQASSMYRSSIVSGATNKTFPGTFGPRLGAVYANRIFYLGFDQADTSTWPGLSSTIFYSQILSGESSSGSSKPYESCYSKADVTSEFFNSINAEDGGSLLIPGIGSPVAADVLGSSLIILSTTGVWALNGGVGEIFRADSQEISKISNAVILTQESLVNTGGNILFWSEEGIISISEGNTPGTFIEDNITQKTYSSGFLELRRLADESGVDIKITGTYQTRRSIVEWDVQSDNIDSSLNRRLRLDLKTRAFSLYSGEYQVAGAVEIYDTSTTDILHYLTWRVITGVIYLTWKTYTGATWLDDSVNDYDCWITTWPEHIGVPHLRHQVSKLTTLFKRTEQNWTGAGTWDNRSGMTATMYWDWADEGGATPKKIGPIEAYRLLRTEDPGSGYPVALVYSNIVVNKHKIRGSGNSLQIKFESKPGMDFQLLGWTLPLQVSTTP